MAEPTLELPKEGEKVGSGIVMDLISAGGSARVYRTWIAALELHRAVKIMNPGEGQEARDRFATEARISSKLNHPNIVHVHNYGETASGLPYIEMEFIPGLTLQTAIQQRGAFPLPVTLAITIGILEALHYAHNLNYTLYNLPQHGVMHRDIKPGNIVFFGGIPKLMDFGIARPVNVSLHTIKDTVPGTVPYMTPESCMGGDMDFRSDIYQIGLMMYECINGYIAYPQKDITTISLAIKNGQRKPLNTSPKTAAIVNKCLEIDPAKRYQTAADCLADVKALYHTISPRTTPEAQISAFLSGITPPIEKTTSRAGDINGRKTLKFAVVAIPCLLLAVGFIVICLTYLKSIPTWMTATPPPPTAEPTPPPPTAAPPTTTPPPPPATPPRPKPTTAPARPSVRDVKDIRDIRDVKDVRDIQDAQTPATTTPPEDAQHLINEAKKLLAQNNAQGALAAFQRALKTPSATLARGEIVKQSLYGTAKCNTILFSQNKIPRANFDAAWKSVQNTYPAGTPEHTEAIKHLNNGAD